MSSASEAIQLAEHRLYASVFVMGRATDRPSGQRRHSPLPSLILRQLKGEFEIVQSGSPFSTGLSTKPEASTEKPESSCG
jgi:hypothetical protein